MKITRITRRVSVVTGKYDSVVVTPFGRFTAESHEAGIAAAQAYVAQYK